MKKNLFFLKNKQQSGFSLLELLFAIFVVALGIVGVIITMNRLVQFQVDSRGDQRAATALSELTQRIRMNEMIATISNTPTNQAFYTTQDSENCLNRPCTLIQLAQRSITAWRVNSVPTILGSGAVAEITPSPATGAITHFNVSLRWPSNADNLAESVNYRSCQPASSTQRCVRVVIRP